MLAKRGISPIIATILLLLLAMGLGVVVMSWGRAQLEASARCSIDLGLKVVEIQGKRQVCEYTEDDERKLLFVIENGAALDLGGIRLVAFGEHNGKQKAYVTDIDVEIPRGYPYIGRVTHGLDRILKAKIVPKVILYPDADPILCPEQALIVENITAC